MVRSNHQLEFGPLRHLHSGCFAMTAVLTEPGGNGRWSRTVECGEQMAAARSPDEIAALMRRRLTEWSAELLAGLE